LRLGLIGEQRNSNEEETMDRGEGEHITGFTGRHSIKAKMMYTVLMQGRAALGAGKGTRHVRKPAVIKEQLHLGFLDERRKARDTSKSEQ